MNKELTDDEQLQKDIWHILKTNIVFRLSPEEYESLAGQLIAAARKHSVTPVSEQQVSKYLIMDVAAYFNDQWGIEMNEDEVIRVGMMYASHSVTPVLSEEQKKNVRLIHAYGLDTRVWGYNKLYGYGCAECCNGDRCDEDCTAKYKGRRRECPHCKGHGWIKEEDATPITNQLSEQEIKEEAEKACPYEWGAEYWVEGYIAALTAHPKQHTDVAKIFDDACTIYGNCVMPEGPCDFNSVQFKIAREEYLSAATEQDREISVWHKGEKLVPESKLLELQQRISQLEQERKGIARDAWDAAIRITGHPFGVKGFAPDKATYLSKFDQTKTEGV